MATKTRALAIARILYGKDGIAGTARCFLFRDGKPGADGLTGCGEHTRGTCPGGQPYYFIGEHLGIARSLRFRAASWAEVIAKAVAHEADAAVLFKRKPRFTATPTRQPPRERTER